MFWSNPPPRLLTNKTAMIGTTEVQIFFRGRPQLYPYYSNVLQPMKILIFLQLKNTSNQTNMIGTTEAQIFRLTHTPIISVL